jgi:hypothetical protein
LCAWDALSLDLAKVVWISATTVAFAVTGVSLHKCSYSSLRSSVGFLVGPPHLQSRSEIYLNSVESLIVFAWDSPRVTRNWDETVYIISCMGNNAPLNPFRKGTRNWPLKFRYPHLKLRVAFT